MAKESFEIGRKVFDYSYAEKAIQILTPNADLTNQALNNRVSWLQIAPTVQIDVTGFVAPTAPLTNQRLLITNTASRTSGFYMRFINNAVSTAANRIYTPNGGNFYLYPGHSCELIYDTGTTDGSRWRIIDCKTPELVTVSIAVPALAAGVKGFVDTSLAGTALANLAPGTPILVNPQADLAAAGANAGYMTGGARISIAGNLRTEFVGTLAGGATNFTVALIG